jgi:hypothetical protein
MIKGFTAASLSFVLALLAVYLQFFYESRPTVYKMSSQSVSRSVVKKVLAIEQAEVCKILVWVDKST